MEKSVSLYKTIFLLFHKNLIKANVKTENYFMNINFSKNNIEHIYELYAKLQTECHMASPIYKKKVEPYLKELRRYLLKNVKEVYNILSS